MDGAYHTTGNLCFEQVLLCSVAPSDFADFWADMFGWSSLEEICGKVSRLPIGMECLFVSWKLFPVINDFQFGDCCYNMVGACFKPSKMLFGSKCWNWENSCFSLISFFNFTYFHHHYWLVKDIDRYFLSCTFLSQNWTSLEWTPLQHHNWIDFADYVSWVAV